MALIGKTNEEKIWNYLKSKGLNDYGCAGLMGNIFAESALNPKNLQNTGNKKLGMTDDEYTVAVDNGTYTKEQFIKDGFGFGLAQWTFWSRKKNFYEFAKSKGKSIGDLETQLNFLYKELSEGYKSILTTLKTATSILAASNAVLLQYERPADQSLSVQNKRASYGQTYYDKYASVSVSNNMNVGGNGKMKYSSNNKPLVCMQTNSTCYKGTRTMTVKGVLWHSTGANNPNLKRYVQPSDNASDRAEMLKILGTNTYKNDWNHIERQAGLNCWIGKLADGTVTTVQTMPWDYRPWGCGAGSKGSCNNGWVQFEICESSLTDKDYFEKVYKEACEITAYICTMYNLDPYGTVDMNGVKVPVILCHADSYKLGMGSNHGDVLHWFNKHDKTMDDVRKDVAILMGKSATSSTVNCPSSIKTLVEKGVINSPNYWTTHLNDLKYLDNLLDKVANAAQSNKINSFNDVKKAINHLVECGVIDTPTYWIANYSKVEYLDELLIKAANYIKSKFPYKVKITVSALNIRKGAGTNYGINGVIIDRGVYTIVDEVMNGSTKWGLLKSGEKNRNKWISLKYTKQI